MEEELAALFSTQPGMANALVRGADWWSGTEGNINGLKQYIHSYFLVITIHYTLI